MSKLNKIEALELEKPTMGFFRGIFVSLGSLLILSGIIMMFTIILILPGAGAFLIGTVVTYFIAPATKADCPACDMELSVRVGSRGIKCDGCGTKSPVRWQKKKTKLNSWSALFGRDKKA